MAQTLFHSTNAVPVTTTYYDASIINRSASHFYSETDTSNTTISNLVDPNLQLKNQTYAKDADIASLQTQIDQLNQQMNQVTYMALETNISCDLTVKPQFHVS